MSSQFNLVFASHLHAMLEMVYVKSGRLVLVLNGQKLTIQAGQAGVVFPNQIHGYETSEPNETDLFLFRGSVLGSIVKRIAHQQPARPIVEVDPRTRDLLQELASGSDAQSQDLSQALLHLAFARMLDDLCLEDCPAAVPEDLTAQMIGYISVHFTQPLTLEKIAQALHINKFSLSRQFCTTMGMGLRTYINCMRVDYAKELLRTTSMPITQLALECGFENQRTFNRSFLKLMGITPKEYRGAKPICP